MNPQQTIVFTPTRHQKRSDLTRQQQRIITRIRLTRTARRVNFDLLEDNTFEIAALFPDWATVERDIRWHFRGVDPKAFIRAVLLAPRLAAGAYALEDDGEKDMAEVYWDQAEACLHLRDRASRPLIDLTGILELLDLPVDPDPVPAVPDTIPDPTALIVETLSAAPRPAPLCRV